jgi:hypothetical protein
VLTAEALDYAGNLSSAEFQCFGNTQGSSPITCSKDIDGVLHIDKILLEGPRYTGSLQSIPPLNLTYLRRFEVVNTSLTGGLPEGIAGPQLYTVTFRDNTLMSGELPQAWGRPTAVDKWSGEPKYPLQELIELSLNGSAWNGSLPAEWGNQLGAFRSLQYLRIIGMKERVSDGSQSYGLTGSIPTEWASGNAFPNLRVCFGGFLDLRLRSCCTCGADMLPPCQGS